MHLVSPNAIACAVRWTLTSTSGEPTQNQSVSWPPDAGVVLWERVTLVSKRSQRKTSLARGTVPFPWRSQWAWPTYQDIYFVLTFRGERYPPRLYGTSITRIKAYRRASWFLDRIIAVVSSRWRCGFGGLVPSIVTLRGDLHKTLFLLWPSRPRSPCRCRSSAVDICEELTRSLLSSGDKRLRLAEF